MGCYIHCTAFTVELWLHSELQFRDCLYKTALTTLYTFKLVPAQHLSSLPSHPLFFPQIYGIHIRTNILSPTLSVFLLLKQHTNQPFSIHCATFHFPIQRVCSYYFSTSTSAESPRCSGVGMIITFTGLSSHCLCCADPGFTAALQQHIVSISLFDTVQTLLLWV